MKRLFAGLALALVVASPVAAGASITAPDGLTFGDTFTVEYEPPNHYSGGLWARADCSQSGEPVYAQYVNLDGTAPGYEGPFVLGPTFLWTGGAADCTVTLVVLNGNHKDHVYASDDFAVGP